MSAPDVIVVGAGPAGSVAALVLARAGVNVRLVDREPFPRSKLCGDTLNPGALSIVDRLGVGSAVRAGGRPLTGMILTGPRGSRVSVDYPDGVAGVAIERRHFDFVLLEAAMAAGVNFTPGVHVLAPVAVRSRVCGVQCQRGAHVEELRARVVVAADGRHSKLASALGLVRFARRPKRWAFGAYFAGVDELGARGEMHIRTDGYTGVAPLGQDVANVCVVGELPRVAPPGHRSSGDVVERAIARNDALRGRFARARRISPATTLGPLAVDATEAGCPGLLLAGDAAGFIDPMTGDGLRFALRGGELAGEAALAELDRDSPAYAHLREARRREFRGKWRFNRALRALVASPRAVGAAEALASWWPAPLNVLVGLAGDVHLAEG